MPIWLRRFIFKTLEEYYNEENKKMDELSKTTKKVPKGPDVKTPTYTSKVKK